MWAWISSNWGGNWSRSSISQASGLILWLFYKIKGFFSYCFSTCNNLGLDWCTENFSASNKSSLAAIYREMLLSRAQQLVMPALLQALVIQMEINPPPRLAGSPTHAAVIGFFTSKGHMHPGFASFSLTFNNTLTWEWKHHKDILARPKVLFHYLQRQNHIYKKNRYNPLKSNV